MKSFQRTGRLRSLPLHSRVAYSAFALFTLLGLGGSVWLMHDMVGISLHGFGEYYSGELAAEPATEAHASAAEGPQLEVPDELLQLPPAEPIATRKLLEVTHFHLFSMPVYLLILSHLYALSATPPRRRLFWIMTASLATALHLAAPWIAAAGWMGAALAYGVSGAALFASYMWMCVVPLLEMWRPEAPVPEQPVAAREP